MLFGPRLRAGSLFPCGGYASAALAPLARRLSARPRFERTPRGSGRKLRRDPLPEDLLQDPALSHVFEIGRIVDAREHTERCLLPVRRCRLDRELGLRGEL